MSMALATSLPTARASVAARPARSAPKRAAVARAAAKPVCALPREEAEERAASSVMVGTLAAALLLAPGAAQADELDDALAKCKTDFCVERTLKKFGAAADYAARAPPAAIEAPVIPEGQSPQDLAEARAAAKAAQEAEAAAKRAAAEQRAAELKAQAEAARAEREAAQKAARDAAQAPKAAPAPAPKAAAAPPKAAEKKPSHTLVGDTFAAVVPAAVMAAGALTVATGSLDDLKAGDSERWLEKVKKGYEAYPNKAVVGSAVALALGTDVVALNLPLLNLLLPAVFQVAGVSTYAYLAYRYTKEGAAPEKDLEEVIAATLPKELPKFNEVTSKTTDVAKEAAEAIKAIDTEKLPEDVKAKAAAFWADIDNKPVFVGYVLASLVALYGVEFVADLPVLSLILPKIFELTGVVMALIAVDRYAVGKTSAIGKDVELFSAKVKAMGLPGTK